MGLPEVPQAVCGHGACRRRVAQEQGVVCVSAQDFGAASDNSGHTPVEV